MKNEKKKTKKHFAVDVTGTTKSVYFTSIMLADLERIKAVANGDKSDSRIVAMALSQTADAVEKNKQ